MNQDLAIKPGIRKGAAIKDITGYKFGHLEVLCPSDERELGYVKWLCRCKCGAFVKRTYISLRSGGKNTSCGCMKSKIAKENLKNINSSPASNNAQKTSKTKRTDNSKRDYSDIVADISNCRFGLLVAVRPSDQRERSSVKWECRCDCGNIVYRSHRVLKSGGDHSSCGCLLPQIRSEGFQRSEKVVDGTNIALLESKNLRSDNKSGFRGVFYSAQRNKWRAEIFFKNKNRHIGMFDTKEEAVQARKEAEEQLFQPVIDAYYESKKLT